MPGSIAEIRALLNGVFGTTCLQKLVLPRSRPPPKIRSPLKLFLPSALTAELGLKGLNENDHHQALVQLMVAEAVKTSEIEGQ
jgi:hypothetical protein